MPGGTANTAGGNAPSASISDAIKTVRWGDFKNVHMYPCARESFLTGIGAGFAVGGVRALLGGTVRLWSFQVIKLT
jgi:cytochrome c oxidase assembly protein subunit 20